MFASLSIFDHELSVRTITILISLCSFVLIGFSILKKTDRWLFISFVPRLFIISLICWSWTSFLLTYWLGALRSLTLSSFLLPHWFQLHFIGVAVWACLSLLYFIFSMSLSQRSYRLWALCDIALWTIIIMWICFTLWDDVIWKYFVSDISIKAFDSSSRLAALGSSFPVGLLISWISLLILWIKKSFSLSWLTWFWLFFVMSPLYLYWQHYPRYGVYEIHGFVLDIKIYLCIALATVFLAFAYKTRSWS